MSVDPWFELWYQWTVWNLVSEIIQQEKMYNSAHHLQLPQTLIKMSTLKTDFYCSTQYLCDDSSVSWCVDECRLCDWFDMPLVRIFDALHSPRNE